MANNRIIEYPSHVHVHHLILIFHPAIKDCDHYRVTYTFLSIHFRVQTPVHVDLKDGQLYTVDMVTN